MNTDTTSNNSYNNLYPKEWPSYCFRTENKCSKCGQDILVKLKKEIWINIDISDFQQKKEIWYYNREFRSC
jgi:hypothetical protein